MGGGAASDPLMLKFEYAQNRLSLNTGGVSFA